MQKYKLIRMAIPLNSRLQFQFHMRIAYCGSYEDACYVFKIILQIHQPYVLSIKTWGQIQYPMVRG